MSGEIDRMAQLRNGDLPPGVYERLPDGRLVPTTKMLTSDPPRPLHVSEQGRITDVTHSNLEFLKDEVQKHYEAREKRSLSFDGKFKEKAKRMIGNAADSVVGD